MIQTGAANASISGHKINEDSFDSSLEDTLLEQSYFEDGFEEYNDEHEKQMMQDLYDSFKLEQGAPRADVPEEIEDIPEDIICDAVPERKLQHINSSHKTTAIQRMGKSNFDKAYNYLKEEWEKNPGEKVSKEDSRNRLKDLVGEQNLQYCFDVEQIVFMEVYQPPPPSESKVNEAKKNPVSSGGSRPSSGTKPGSRPSSGNVKKTSNDRVSSGKPRLLSSSRGVSSKVPESIKHGPKTAKNLSAV